MKKFELKEGHEIRGMMIRLYPDKETVAALKMLEGDSRHLWNWLVKQTEDVLDARAAYAIRYGLVEPKPIRPNYEGLEPALAAAKAAEHRKSVGAWHQQVHTATSKLPCCSFRKFKDLLGHYGAKHDYQLLKRVLGWSRDESESRPVEPGAHMLQALTKNYFSKSDRRKKFRKAVDAMPLQVRSSDCFKLGSFGLRRGKDFYDCQVSFNGLKIKGRLPGKTPEGRVLEGVSITEKADGWWASIKLEIPKRVLPDPVPGTVVGIDVGLDFVAAFSDGTPPVPNKRSKELAERIAGRQALKRPVGRLHLQAARHAKHEIYNRVLKPMARVEMIKIERLEANIGQRGSTKVSSMRLVAAMLKERYGDRVREVEPHYTSQDCSQCGHRSKETWSYAHGRMGECPKCDYRADRDFNAARNIAAKDLISLAS